MQDAGEAVEPAGLGEEAVGPLREAALPDRGLGAGTQDHHNALRIAPAQRGQHREAVGARQGQVEHQRVRPQRGTEGECGVAVMRDSQYLEPWVFAQQVRHPPGERPGIVDDQNPQEGVGGHHRRR